jgi:O-antigen/teichoic acid export membrane protein
MTLLLTMVLARVLGAESYGVYTYVLSLVSLLAIPAQLGLPSLVVRETAKAQANEDWSLMRGLWRWSSWMTIGSALLIALLAWGAMTLWPIDFSKDQRLIFAVGLLLIPLIALGNLLDGALRGLRHIVLGNLSELVLRPGLLLLILLLIGWTLPNYRLAPLEVMLLNAVIAGITIATASILLNYKKPVSLASHACRYECRNWLVAALPLAFIAGMQLINQHISILTMGYFLTTKEVGIFKVAASVAGAVAFALYTINMVVAPYFARLYAQNDKARLQYLVTLSCRAIFAFSVPVVLVLLLFGKKLLALIFSDEYVLGYESLIVLVFGQLVNAATGSVSMLLNMTGYERDTAKGFMVSALLNIALNLVLVPISGMAGAAYASALSLALWNIILMRLAYRRVGILSFVFSPVSQH